MSQLRVLTNGSSKDTRTGMQFSSPGSTYMIVNNATAIAAITGMTSASVVGWTRPTVNAEYHLFTTKFDSARVPLALGLGDYWGAGATKFSIGTYNVSDAGWRAVQGSTTTPTAGTHYHVGGTWASGGNQILYVNGAQEATLAAGTINFAGWTGGEFYLAHRWDVAGTNNFHSGVLSGWAVWNRVLTSTEMSNLYAAGSADYDAAVLALSPSFFWKLNETSGTTVTNYGSVGANGNGTLVNGAILNVPGSAWSTQRAKVFDGTNWI